MSDELFGVDDGAEAEKLAEPLKGHCLCRAVSITLHGTRPLVDICHCDMCVRWSGTFLGGLSGDSADITGRDNIGIYKSSEWAERAFCKVCGSNLWYEFTPTGHTSFLAGLFDVPKGLGILQQIFVDEKPDWYDLAQKSPMKTGAEVIAEAKAAGFEFE